MSNVWFCSDLHLDHENIPKFRRHVTSVQHNTDLIFQAWAGLVTPRDTVYVLGDACFSYESLCLLGTLPGKKILIRGNHDDYVTTGQLLEVFSSIEGTFRYKNFWLTHAPMHPVELRGKINLHGHVHYSTVQRNPEVQAMGERIEKGMSKGEGDDDPRYVNCCVEHLVEIVGRPLIALHEVRELLELRLMRERGGDLG